MSEFKGQQTLSVVFTTISAMQAYNMFLPSVFQVRTSVDSLSDMRMIREGEFIATSFIVGLSIITAILTRSPFPLGLVVLICGAMLGSYEYALARSPLRQGQL